jgi:RNA-directed DNA polymerase
MRSILPRSTRPDVVDRVVCEAVRQVLEPLWEPTFHPSSHGFRPSRSCHTAIAEAKQHLEDGYEWCVDLDLENSSISSATSG